MLYCGAYRHILSYLSDKYGYGTLLKLSKLNKLYRNIISKIRYHRIYKNCAIEDFDNTRKLCNSSEYIKIGKKVGIFFDIKSTIEDMIYDEGMNKNDEKFKYKLQKKIDNVQKYYYEKYINRKTLKYLNFTKKRLRRLEISNQEIDVNLYKYSKNIDELVIKYCTRGINEIIKNINGLKKLELHIGEEYLFYRKINIPKDLEYFEYNKGTNKSSYYDMNGVNIHYLNSKKVKTNRIYIFDKIHEERTCNIEDLYIIFERTTYKERLNRLPLKLMKKIKKITIDIRYEIRYRPLWNSKILDYISLKIEKKLDELVLINYDTITEKQIAKILLYVRKIKIVDSIGEKIYTNSSI